MSIEKNLQSQKRFEAKTSFRTQHWPDRCQYSFVLIDSLHCIDMSNMLFNARLIFVVYRLFYVQVYNKIYGRILRNGTYYILLFLTQSFNSSAIKMFLESGFLIIRKVIIQKISYKKLCLNIKIWLELRSLP